MAIPRVALATIAGLTLAVSWSGLAQMTAAPAATRLLRQPTVSAIASRSPTRATSGWSNGRRLARRITSFQGDDHESEVLAGRQVDRVQRRVQRQRRRLRRAVEGGEPKRLTWHPGAITVQGWTRDGKAIMFASSRATWAPTAAPTFWTVPIEGGIESPLALPRGYQGKISPDGSHVAYRMNTSWDEERRNYRGGQNRPVWIVDLKSFDLVSPPWTDSKDTDPVWLGDTVYFLSDRDGIANVWAFTAKSKALRQVTKFTDYDVKAIDAGGGTIVIEQGGFIHEVDPGSGRTKPLTITAAGDFPWMMPRWEDISSRVSQHRRFRRPASARWSKRAGRFSPSQSKKGDVRNLTQSSGAAERDPGVVAGREIHFVLQRQDGRIPARARRAGWSVAAEGNHAAETHALLHGVLVAGFQEVDVFGHQRERVGAGHRERTGEVGGAR
jgi:tricorn protease